MSARYEQRKALVTGLLGEHGPDDETSWSELAEMILDALDHIPEKGLV